MAEIVYQRERPYYYDWYYSPQGLLAGIVNAVLGIVEILFALRIVLQLLSANPGSQFVAWLYSFTDRLASPFLGAFPAVSVGGFVIELSIVFAMTGYAFIAWLFLKLISLVFVPLDRTL